MLVRCVLIHAGEFPCSFQDSEFYEECKREYLEERDKYRTSGESPQKLKRTS